MRAFLLFTLLLTSILFCPDSRANELRYRVTGVDGDMAANVLSSVQPFRLSGKRRLNLRRAQAMAKEAEVNAALALRPFGYYHAEVRATPVQAENGDWSIDIEVSPGEPVMVREVEVQISGPGEADSALRNWRTNFALKPGQVLNQVTWEQQKSMAIDAAAVHGYLSAQLSTQRIDLDLEQNRADLRLDLDTGPQAVMGRVRFEQDAVREGILELLPRWETGQPYDQWLLEEFRLDLWRTGYFEAINVLEQRRLDESPPIVDILTQLEARKKNTYQGSLGYGSDSGIRLNATWHRYLLSKRGDSLNLGVGWQQRDNEYSMRASYRLPWRSSAHNFWTVDARYRSEQQDLLVRPDDGESEFERIARGTVEDYLVVPGMLRIRNLERGYQRVFEHWFVRLLSEKPSFTLVGDSDLSTDGIPGAVVSDVEENSYTWAPGVNWEWPMIRGNGYETVGHRSILTLFTSNKAWGSDFDFSQIYLYSAWNHLFADRWKVLLRGEIGWSDARVEDVTVDTGTRQFDISLTELPYAYRFKAGGSRSVRGYGFESLSNNNIGSNNIVTLSTELEYRWADSWSVAGFFDAGNAFNEWSGSRLKKGYGLGVRWYSIAGAVRLDVAQALDEPGHPWRIHFTIGTPLL